MREYVAATAAEPAAADADDCGCLLPLLDMLNHGFARQITWITSRDTLVFQVNERIAPGEEVRRDLRRSTRHLDGVALTETAGSLPQTARAGV